MTLSAGSAVYLMLWRQSRALIRSVSIVWNSNTHNPHDERFAPSDAVTEPLSCHQDRRTGRGHAKLFLGRLWALERGNHLSRSSSSGRGGRYADLAEPDLTPAQVTERLQMTSHKHSSMEGKISGGLLDMEALMASVKRK
jgi:hypothetical protein